MKDEKYCMSFTTGGLFHHESVKLVLLFLKTNDWSMVRDEVLSNNVLQTRTVSSAKRICSEVISRLKTLSFVKLDFLVNGNTGEQEYLLWLAVCLRYKFIGEFATEVLRERYITLKHDLDYENFDFFFNSKAEWHVELEALQPATKTKLRRVLFKILREANLLTATNTINAAMLSSEFLEMIRQDNPEDVFFFPIMESVLKRGMR